MNAHTRWRVRATDCPVFEIPLAPEVALSIRWAAVKAGMTAEQLVADVLRDVFEPVFQGRGAIAAKEASK